jgi:hypothetical protein
MAAELSTDEATRDNPAKEQSAREAKRQSSSERGGGGDAFSSEHFQT